MKIIKLMINIFFWLTPICLYPKESTSIEQNLVKLIVDWGFGTSAFTPGIERTFHEL